jgi:hypothetical protein
MRPFVKMIVRGLAACGFGATVMCAGASTAGDLEGRWELVEIDSRPIPPQAASARPEFTIKGRSIEGFDGCSTRRGCADDAVKLPLDLADPMSHLAAGTMRNDTLSLPARGGIAKSVFRRVQSK